MSVTRQVLIFKRASWMRSVLAQIDKGDDEAQVYFDK